MEARREHRATRAPAVVPWVLAVAVWLPAQTACAMPSTESLAHALGALAGVLEAWHGAASAIGGATRAMAGVLRAEGVHDGACPALRGVGLAFLMLAGLVVVAVARLRLAVEQRRLDLARRLVEQGHEPPNELLRGHLRNDLRKGVVLIFAGLGLVATAAVTGERGFVSGGLIPAFIGMGYLVSYRLAERNREQRQ